jgi:hypothetical protein
MPQLAYAPICLVPSSTKSGNGAGPVIELDGLRGKLLQVTLVINHVVEYQALDISIWGSASDIGWGAKPLFSFPRKSYCGVYTTFLNLANYPTVRYLHVEWKMSRLRNRNSRLMFGFSVSLEEPHTAVNTAVA